MVKSGKNSYFLLFDAPSALPLADSEIVSDDAILSDPVPAQDPRKEITIDASIQANAHVVVPESVAEKLVQIMVEAFNTQKSGKVKRPQSPSKLITCDLLPLVGSKLCVLSIVLLWDTAVATAMEDLSANVVIKS
nr:uncharacterized protein LOC118682988 isoform X2 [Bactrocera oleae]